MVVTLQGLSVLKVDSLTFCTLRAHFCLSVVSAEAEAGGSSSFMTEEELGRFAHSALFIRVTNIEVCMETGRFLYPEKNQGFQKIPSGHLLVKDSEGAWNGNGCFHTFR